MTEEILNNSKRIALVGSYRVIQNPDGFRLERLSTVSDDFPDTEAFVFISQSEAEGTAHVLSRAFQKGYSRGTSTFRIGNVIEAEMSGREPEHCKLYRLDKDGKRNGEPIEPKSPHELVETLAPFFKRER